MSSIHLVKLIDLPILGDDRGQMSVIENATAPFDIQRIFYVYNTNPHVVRGQHANQKSQFLMVCVSGHVDIKVMDTTGVEKVYHLNDLTKGLYLPQLIWKDMYNWGANTVLLVLSDQAYDPDEYIRDREMFLN